MKRIRISGCLVLAFFGLISTTARSQETASVPEAQAPVADRPVRISSGVMAGLRVSGDAPVYPPDAKAQGISGSVVLHAIVGRDGTVQSLAVVSGNSLLSTAALNAVKTWSYKPFLLNGEPVDVDTTITVNFNAAITASAIDPNVGPPLVRDGHKLIRVGGSVLQKMRSSSVPPVYPDEAKTAHVQGTVILQVVLGKDGSIEEEHVVSGPPELTQAAIDAVKQWRYKLFMLNGEPVELQSTVTINFNLGELG